MTILYGIKNCDTVKKARAWLDANNIQYQFHDFRADGISSQKVDAWIDRIGVETLINKRSTTWKELTPAQQQDLSKTSATQLILDNPTLIKRPLVEHADEVFVGFKDADYTSKFK